MQIKTLTEDQKPLYARIFQDSFVVADSYMPTWAQYAPTKDLRGIFDDEGTLLSGLRFLWNDLWLGNSKVKMAGITNVSTPPEHRRHGYLRQLLLATLAEERENGYNVSGLYPFEFPFYRKFGYELASATQEVAISVAALAQFKTQTKGRWKKANADDWQKFKELYDTSCVGKFGRNTREQEVWWRRRIFILLQNGVAKNNEAYLWYDEAGKARAYIVFSYKNLAKDWDREIIIRDMVWLDEAARHEIFAFFANQDSQALKIWFSTEPGDEILSRLSDPRQAELKLQPGYMLRLVDVKGALAERSWPEEACGKISIAVKDDTMEWNDNQTYQMEIEAGKASVKTTQGTDSAGLSCDVRTLAQLYAGYLTIQTAVRLNKLVVHNPAELKLAGQIFSPPGQPASFMVDFW